VEQEEETSPRGDLHNLTDALERGHIGLEGERCRGNTTTFEIHDRDGASETEPVKGGGHMFRVVREYAKFALSTLSSVMYHTT
jgi:hypothetical protein